MLTLSPCVPVMSSVIERLSGSSAVTTCDLFFQVMPSSCDSLIDDIEDMVSSSEPAPLQRSNTRQSVVPRVRKRKDLTANEELQVDR